MKGTAFAPNNGALYIEHVKNRKKYDMVQQHYHDAYEIYLQLDGRRYAFYDNICYTLSRGDLAVFKPFEIHYEEIAYDTGFSSAINLSRVFKKKYGISPRDFRKKNR